MKKAVIVAGGTQHLVAEGDEITVNLLNTNEKSVSFDPIAIIDGKSTKVGNPTLSGVSVVADVVDADSQGDKVIAIRYKSKKRVHTLRGHRQRLTTLKIKSIK